MRIARVSFARAATCVGLLLLIASCGASSSVERGAGPASGNASFDGRENDFAVVFADPAKLASYDDGEFSSQRYGAEYASDLPSNRCGPEGYSIMLDSAWQQDAPNDLSVAAYCLYRLRLYTTLEYAKLTVVWEGEAPPDGSCWIGLPDWQRMCWNWQTLPESNEIELLEPALSANEQDQCYAAVVLLDDGARSLASIGFGELEPPPVPAQYTLFDPMMDSTSYLIDMDGELVHSWATARVPATCSYLLENGLLLRPGRVENPEFGYSAGGGGIIELIDWDSNVVWSFTHSTSLQLMHHDTEPLPNGNILAIVWERKTGAEAIAAGRNPALISNSRIDIDSIFEIQPLEEGGGEVIWEWHLWDHLIQDFDPEQDNYGAVAEHPELVDFNYPNKRTSDFSHFNAIAYNAELDQIVVSANSLNEIWIIDHSTTTAEAASHSGGNSGRGGDIIYRWGNPEAYDVETLADKQLFGVHNVHWIPDGLPGAGHLMMFNNGLGRPDGSFSTVDEIITPLEANGTYRLVSGEAYEPEEATWSFKHSPPEDLYSYYISGAQRLPNGNTFICSGATGWFLEVTPAGEVIWEYTNPYTLFGGYAVFRATRLFEDYPGLSNLLPEE